MAKQMDLESLNRGMGMFILANLRIIKGMGRGYTHMQMVISMKVNI
jgi:hypothetical protein